MPTARRSGRSTRRRGGLLREQSRSDGEESVGVDDVEEGGDLKTKSTALWLARRAGLRQHGEGRDGRTRRAGLSGLRRYERRDAMSAETLEPYSSGLSKPLVNLHLKRLDRLLYPRLQIAVA